MRFIAGARIDRERREVRVRALGIFESHAVYREQLGCTLLHEKTAEQLRAEWAPAAVAPRAPIPVAASGGAAAYDEAAITRALDEGFEAPAGAPPRNTMAIVVVHDGKVIAERYAPGVGAETPLLGWSMTKSVFFALAGILEGEGKLDVEAPAPIAEWRDPADPRHAITLDALLRMTSGLALPERKSPYDSVSRMLFREPDMAAYTARARLAAAPGAHWEYSSGSTLLVARAIREASGGTLADQVALADRALFTPLGIESAVIEPDESGTLIGSSYMHASARDWARLGEFYLADGVWDGKRILPEGWMASGLRPAAGAPQRKYGSGFWLNAGTEGDPADRLWKSLPVDAFAALGFQGQCTFVVPSKRLVIVRLGYPKKNKDAAVEELVAAIVAALD